MIRLPSLGSIVREKGRANEETEESAQTLKAPQKERDDDDDLFRDSMEKSNFSHKAIN